MYMYADTISNRFQFTLKSIRRCWMYLVKVVITRIRYLTKYNHLYLPVKGIRKGRKIVMIRSELLCDKDMLLTCYHNHSLMINDRLALDKVQGPNHLIFCQNLLYFSFPWTCSYQWTHGCFPRWGAHGVTRFWQNKVFQSRTGNKKDWWKVLYYTPSVS